LETRLFNTKERNTDLNGLKEGIVNYLQGDGFKVQAPASSSGGWLIQAQKGGFLREVISAERALNIMIQGQPNSFGVRIGVGKCIQNAAVTGWRQSFSTSSFSRSTWRRWRGRCTSRKFIKKIDELVSSTTVLAR
jgi:hypothetical protein